MENKSFDVICEGRKMEGMRICENGKGFQFLISLEEEVAWIIGAFEDFLLEKERKTWGKHMQGSIFQVSK